MNRMTKLILPVLGLCLAFSTQAKVMESSVATVNGQPILASDYDQFYNAMIEQYQAAAPQMLEQPYAKDMLGKQVLKELISKQLVLQDAKNNKIIVKDSELEEALTQIKSRFAIDEKGQPDPKGAEKRFNAELKKEHLTLSAYKKKLENDLSIKKQMEARVQATVKPVEDTDVKALYTDIEAVMKNDTKALKKLEKENPARLQEAQLIAAKLMQLTAEQVRVGHIFLATTKDMTEAQKKEKEKLAKDIKAQIDKGDLEFSKAVQQYTEDKNALVSGGDMMLIKGIAPKEIDQAAFSLPVGKVSSPIKSELGWHIIKVKEKRAKQDVTYDMVAQQLAQYLAQQRIEMAMAEYVNGLADKADIKVTKKFEVDAVIEKAAAERAAQEAKKEAEKATK